MTATASVERSLFRARFDPRSTATLDGLVPLEYEREAKLAPDLPPFVRAASALRRFQNRLVIVQDDVDVLAVGDAGGGVRPVLLPLHASGRRSFDDAAGNKKDKMDLEACVTLPDGRFLAFGSGSTSMREGLVVWSGGAPPVKMPATMLYANLRSAVTRGEARLNIEGAVVADARLLLFHRGNDVRPSERTDLNAIGELDLREFVSWLDGRASAPRVIAVTDVDLGEVGGVPFGFTDAVALDAERIVVLACAEDSACAVSDGAVLGCRVGLLEAGSLRTVDVVDATGARTLRKLEGIECRPGTDVEFDVVVDVDRPACPAELGRLVWAWW